MSQLNAELRIEIRSRATEKSLNLAIDDFLTEAQGVFPDTVLLLLTTVRFPVYTQQSEQTIADYAKRVRAYCAYLFKVVNRMEKHTEQAPFPLLLACIRDNAELDGLATALSITLP